MEFWIALPNGGTAHDNRVSISLILEVANAAEELGFDGLFVKDHLVPPQSDEQQMRLHGRIFEAVVTLAYLVGQTRRIKLGTSILVAPMRNAVLLAKQLATIDVMSGGRLTAGFGVGYVEREFRNVGADFHSRGRLLDESIELMRHLFSGDLNPFRGEFYELEDYAFDPVPVQGGQLPILVGGDSHAALRRAARLGDIWQSSTMGVDQYEHAVTTLRELANGREIKPAALIRMGMGYRATELSGSSQELIDEVRKWKHAGCELLSIGFWPVSEIIPKMTHFAQEVVPSLRDS